MLYDSKASFRRPKFKAIALPDEPNDTYCIRVMSGKDRESFTEYAKGVTEDSSESELHSTLLVRCLCDSEGNRIFADSDVAELVDLPGNDARRLFDAAYEYNRIGGAAIDAAKKNLKRGTIFGTALRWLSVCLWSVPKRK